MSALEKSGEKPSLPAHTGQGKKTPSKPTRAKAASKSKTFLGNYLRHFKKKQKPTNLASMRCKFMECYDSADGRKGLSWARGDLDQPRGAGPREGAVSTWCEPFLGSLQAPGRRRAVRRTGTTPPASKTAPGCRKRRRSASIFFSAPGGRAWHLVSPSSLQARGAAAGKNVSASSAHPRSQNPALEPKPLTARVPDTQNLTDTPRAVPTPSDFCNSNRYLSLAAPGRRRWEDSLE